MKNFLLISVFVLLSACAKDKGDTDVAAVPAPTENTNPIPPVGPSVLPEQNPQRNRFGYHYDDGRCSTGPQRYMSLRAYCEGLRNDRRNNHCATQARYQDFRQYCSQYRWQR